MSIQTDDLVPSPRPRVVSAAPATPQEEVIERALQATATTDVDTYRRGVELIHKQVLDMLKRRHVTPIDVKGVDFDPRVHQAVSQEASASHREGEVVDELRRGYMLGERLLRAAMVKVATRE